jgi:hypothetical protein
MDFTIKIYRQLIDQLITSGYQFQTFSEFLGEPENRVTMLRHDVEKKYQNALILAEIQKNLNIKGTYFFRILKDHYDEEIIIQISQMGHEVGYHYDDLSYCKGNLEFAIERFKKNLENLRKIVPVNTICMEGAPLSKYDNRKLWESYRMKDYKIVGEPYFDINFNEVFYLTDTGRSWSGKFSVRDKSQYLNYFKIKSNLNLRTTIDLINAAKHRNLPDKIMMTFHPQRWNEKYIPWTKEFLFQNLKNQIKKFYINKGK